MRRALVTVALVAAVALGGCAGDRSTAAPRTTTRITTTTTTVSVAVVSRQVTFEDAARHRSLVTTIWAPTSGGPFPLVVFAHGFGATAPTYDVFTKPLAAAGFVVAAPTFPRTSRGAPGGPTIADVVNQPTDVSVVIDRVLALNAAPSDPLHGRVDVAHIAAAGHSLGAITTLGVAFNRCCRDDRVDAAVVLAGLEWPFAGGRFDAGRGTPVLFVHGDQDNVVPYAAGRRAYDDAAPPKWFVTIIGGGHVTTDAAQQVLFRSAVDFLNGELRHQPGALDRLSHDADLAGVARVEHLSG